MSGHKQQRVSMPACFMLIEFDRVQNFEMTRA
jgi:hypothetical protein